MIQHLNAVAIAEYTDAGGVPVHLAQKQSVLLNADHARIHSVYVERVVKLSLKNAIFNRDRPVAVHKVRCVCNSGIRQSLGAAGVEAVQPYVAAGLRDKSHTVAGQHGHVAAGDIRRVTAEYPRAHAPRGGNDQNIPDRRVAAHTVEAQPSVGEIFAHHIADTRAKIMIGGPRHILARVSYKLHVQLYPVVAGAARLGAGQLPAAHVKLLTALHDLGVHIAVAVGDYAHLHSHALRIFQCNIPHGNGGMKVSQYASPRPAGSAGCRRNLSQSPPCSRSARRCGADR